MPLSTFIRELEHELSLERYGTICILPVADIPVRAYMHYVRMNKSRIYLTEYTDGITKTTGSLQETQFWHYFLEINPIIDVLDMRQTWLGKLTPLTRYYRHTYSFKHVSVYTVVCLYKHIVSYIKQLEQIDERICKTYTFTINSILGQLYDFSLIKSEEELREDILAAEGVFKALYAQFSVYNSDIPRELALQQLELKEKNENYARLVSTLKEFHRA